MIAVHSLPAERRRQLAAQYVGRLVQVTYDRRRDAATATTLRGRLLAVAQPLTGAAADELVLELSPSPAVFTISLATVLELELAPLSALVREAEERS